MFLRWLVVSALWWPGPQPPAALPDRPVARVQAVGVPSVTLARWQNEAQISLRLLHREAGTSRVDSDAARWTAPDLSLRFYDLDPHVIPEGGYEVEAIYPRPPPTNVLTFALETRGLEFFYQPPLAHAEEDGSTWERGPTGGIRRRPALVGGSYAAYGPTSGDFSAIGGQNYRSGKAFHIYRPWAEDATGRRTWADLHIAGDRLTVTTPQAFLDAAVYPVLVDPTFGYTTTGGSDDNIGGAHILAKATSTPAAGTLDSVTIVGRISVDLDALGNHPNHAPALFSDSSSAPNARLAASDVQGTLYTGSNAAVTTNLTYGSLGATQYWIGSRQGGAVGVGAYGGAGMDAFFRYDANGGATELYYKVAGGDTAWEADSTGFSNAANERVTLYGTYTASGGGFVPSMLLLGVGCVILPVAWGKTRRWLRRVAG